MESDDHALENGDISAQSDGFTDNDVTGTKFTQWTDHQNCPPTVPVVHRFTGRPSGFRRLWVRFLMVLLEFNLHNSSGCTMALGSTQLLTEMSTRNISGGGSQCIRVTTLPPPRADCHYIWEPQPAGTLRACPGLYRDSLTFSGPG